MTRTRSIAVATAAAAAAVAAGAVPGAGGQVILNGPLRGSDGAKAGVLDAVFTTTASNAREQLVITLTLPEGSITAQGIDAAASSDTLAITGGTRRYDGTRGTLTATAAEER